MKSRTKLLIYNIVVAAICIAVIVSFFIAPFWQVKVSYNLTPETVKGIVEKAGAGSGSSDGTVDPDNPLSGIQLSDEDYEKVLGEGGMKISVTVQLKTADLLASLAGGTEKEQESVHTLIDSNVTYIVGELVPKLNTLVRNAMPVVSKVVINQAISEQLDKAIADTGSEEIRQAMEEAGLTNSFIEEKSETLVEAIYAEGATVDSITDTVVETVSEVFEMMKKSPNPELNGVGEFTPENEEQIRDQVKQALSMLADEDGKINADEFVAELILRGLEQANGGSQEGGEQEGSGSQEGMEPEGGEQEGDGGSEENGEVGEPIGATRSFANLADSEETGDTTEEEMSSTEKLKIQLTKMVMDKINDDTIRTLAIVMMVLSGLILFTMFTWAYLILKMVVKLFCKNPGIKLGLPIWLGWLPFLFLVLTPTIVLAVIKGNPGIIASIAGADAAANLVSQLSAISIGFSSCTIVAAIGALALFVLYFFYRRPRKRLKRLKRLRKINPNATEADL